MRPFGSRSPSFSWPRSEWRCVPGLVPHCPAEGSGAADARGTGDGQRVPERPCPSGVSGRGLSAFRVGIPPPSPQLGMAVPRGGKRVPTEGLGHTVPGGPGRFGLQGEGQGSGRGPGDVCGEGQRLFSTHLPRAVPGRGPGATALLPSTPGVRPALGSDVGNCRAGFLGRAADPGWENGRHPWNWGEARPCRGPGAAACAAGSQLQLRDGREATRSPPGHRDSDEERCVSKDS